MIMDTVSQEQLKNSNITVTDRGSMATLKNSLGDKRLIYLRGDGYTEQDGEPTPDAPIDIQGLGDGGTIGVKTCRKNLLNATLNTTIGSNNKYLIKVNPNTQYTLTLKQKCVTFSEDNPKAQHWTAQKDADGNTITGTSKAICVMVFSAVDEVLTIRASFTTVSNADTLYLDLGTYTSSSLRIQTIEAQLEEGDTATDYEPYTETTASFPVTAPLYEGDYIEVYADGSGQIVRESRKFKPSTISNIREFTDCVAGTISLPNHAKERLGVCNYLVSKMDKSNGTFHFGDNATGKFSTLFVYIDGLTTKEEYQAWLDGHSDIEFIYELSEPTTEPLTAKQVREFMKLYTFDNITHITSDGVARLEVTGYQNNNDGKVVGVNNLSDLFVYAYSMWMKLTNVPTGVSVQTVSLGSDFDEGEPLRDYTVFSILNCNNNVDGIKILDLYPNPSTSLNALVEVLVDNTTGSEVTECGMYTDLLLMKMSLFNTFRRYNGIKNEFE